MSCIIIDRADRSCRAVSHSLVGIAAVEMRGRVAAGILALMLASGGRTLWAQTSGQDPVWETAVYVVNRGPVPVFTLNRAELIASKILSTASIGLRWHIGAAPEENDSAGEYCSPTAHRRVTITADFAPQHIAAKAAEAVAYSYPYAETGVRIQILYERLAPTFAGSPGLAASVLGHVLAHEIAHVLQRMDHHSASGIMKAHWGLEDYREMKQHPLRFLSEDITLIRLGMQSWTHHACSQPAAGTSSAMAQNTVRR